MRRAMHREGSIHAPIKTMVCEGKWLACCVFRKARHERVAWAGMACAGTCCLFRKVRTDGMAWAGPAPTVCR